MTAASFANSRTMRSPSAISSRAPSTSPRAAGAGSWLTRRSTLPRVESVERAQGRRGSLGPRLRQHAGILGALALFLVLYLFYQANHPRGFTGQVLIQNANEVFALALVSMAQTVPVLMAGLDLSVGAVMTLVGCIASHLVNGSPGEIVLGIVDLHRRGRRLRLRQWLRGGLWTDPADHRNACHERHLYGLCPHPAADARRQGATRTCPGR